LALRRMVVPRHARRIPDRPPRPTDHIRGSRPPASLPASTPLASPARAIGCPTAIRNVQPPRLPPLASIRASLPSCPTCAPPSPRPARHRPGEARIAMRSEARPTPASYAGFTQPSPFKATFPLEPIKTANNRKKPFTTARKPVFLDARFYQSALGDLPRCNPFHPFPDSCLKGAAWPLP